MSKWQLQSANVANTKKGEGIDFYFILNACRMRINTKEGECKDKFVLKRFEIRITCFPSYPEFSNLKSRDARSERISPDGRTRGGHARKRAARDKACAAETRPKPRFRGNMDEAEYQILWLSFTGTLLPPAPINTPAEQQM